jgi:Tfp pilus assembly protein PilO
VTLARRIVHEKRRFIYPLVAAILINAALLVAVVLPLSRRVANGEVAAQAAATALAQARRDHAAARATVTGKTTADEELKKFYGAVLPVDQSQARRVTFKLNDMSRKAGLVAGPSVTKASQARDSTLGKLTIEQTLTGQYRNLRQFIYDLETVPEFLILENVALSQATEGASGLVMKVRVATYYRTTEDGR